MADPAAESQEEIKRRKDEYEKLKEEPGMEHVLRARDYLHALTFERGEPAPGDKDVLEYLAWSEANRLPVPPAFPREDRESAGEFEQLIHEPHGRAPRRDMSNLIGGGGLALIGRMADSLETLFDGGRSPQQIERDNSMSGEKQRIEQIVKAEQERQQQAQEEKARKHELDLFLAQRDRERHHDRGR